MTQRQVALISNLVAACWARNEKVAATLLLELLGPELNEKISAQLKTQLKGH